MIIKIYGLKTKIVKSVFSLSRLKHCLGKRVSLLELTARTRTKYYCWGGSLGLKLNYVFGGEYQMIILANFSKGK